MPDRRLLAHRLPALAFAAFLVVIAGSAAVLFALKMGLGPGHVAAYYRGDAAAFAPAKSFDGLLLVAVPHLAAIPLVLFAAAHVVGWARALPGRWHRALLVLSFGCAALSIGGGFLVRYGPPALAWLKIAAFAGLEAALLAWAALLVRVFLPLRHGLAVGTPGVAKTRPAESTTIASTPASRASR
ncbi:MAG: hypothetical protein U0229_01755 [Anaeromyxobacter sp.]